MMTKVFWFDCGTTGWHPAEHDIVQLAYSIEIDGDVKTAGTTWR